MIANKEKTIIEEVRSYKEVNAARHDFDVSKIIAAARKRQESSGRPIIRLTENDINGTKSSTSNTQAG